MLCVQILEYIDDHFPGWVECAFVDAFSQRHLLHEKVPVVTTLPLTATSTYPQSGFIACEVEDSWLDDTGRRLVRVNTETLWGVQTAIGTSQFVVLQTQLCTDDPEQALKPPSE